MHEIRTVDPCEDDSGYVANARLGDCRRLWTVILRMRLANSRCRYTVRCCCDVELTEQRRTRGGCWYCSIRQDTGRSSRV